MKVDEMLAPVARVEKPARPAPSGGRFLTWYKACALICFNTFILLLICNGILALVYLVFDWWQEPGPMGIYPEASLAAVYPNLDRNERRLLLHESWTHPLMPENFTQFKEAPYSGKYVNVTPVGYRKSIRQAPWPPEKHNLTVFVFGGSTTFGYGLPDDETLPSYLQEAFSRHTKKNVSVYNFGVGCYYLTQERLRFEKLLLDGYRPDIAVFVDGINEEYRIADPRPNHGRPGTEVAAPQGALPALRTFLRSLPLARAVKEISNRFRPRREPDPPSEEQVQEQLRTYFVNQTMVRSLARDFGLTPIFVWQPSPYYEYDLKYHLFLRQTKGSRLYTAMAEKLREKPPPADLLWCADMQKQERECLYVDGVHYCAKFAKKLADRICQLCVERHILAGHGIGVE
jgi:lysophospholipase L1-like esterase